MPRILTLDIETWGSRYFAFGIIYDSETKEYHYFNTSREIKEYILGLIDHRKRAEKIQIWGHNIAYDLNWVFDNYEMYFANAWNTEKNGRRRFYKKVISRDGRFYEAKLWNITFMDTFNLFPASLQKAGQFVGIKKDIDKRKKFEIAKKPGIITEVDIEYCKSDCLITYELLMKLKELTESYGGTLKRTVASTVVTILKKYNPNFIKYLEGMNKGYNLSNLDEKFRSAYYGGRTECHLREGKNLKYYDVNSLYPYVMSDDSFHYPDPLTLFDISPSVKNLKTALKEYEGTAEIKIFVPDDIEFPVLPFRVRKIDGYCENKIIYPTGIFFGNWNFPEIRLALKMGCQILEVTNITAGHRIESPWKNYIIDMYAERLRLKEAEDPAEYALKFWLNSPYGKFGQRDFENRIITMKEADDMPELDNKIYDVIYYKGVPYVKYTTEPTRSRMDILCLCSYVTSHARCVIYGYYEECGFDIYYSDTDSLITSHELKTGTAMGMMKDELPEGIEYASFKGRKDYLLIAPEKAMIKRKGCSLKMVSALETGGKKTFITPEIKQKFDNNDIETLKLYHNADKLYIDKIVKSRESLRRELDAGRILEGEKSRLKAWDDGKSWDNDISIPYKIKQEGLNMQVFISFD